MKTAQFGWTHVPDNWMVTPQPLHSTLGISTLEVLSMFYFYFLLILLFGGVGVLYLFGKNILKWEQ